MENSYWVYHLSFDDPVLKPLYAKYEAKFGEKATEIVNIVAAYDIIYWIADAIKRAGKADGAGVRDAIENTKNLKLLHFTLTVDKATHNPLNKPAAILQFKKEKKEAIFVEMFAPPIELLGTPPPEPRQEGPLGVPPVVPQGRFTVR